MAVALTVIQPEAVKTLCDCRYGACMFTVPRVRFYLVIWHQARIAREPFDVVFRDSNRSSNLSDPAIRGGRHDSHSASMIGWSLEQARDRGGLSLNAWNADKIAAFLCPDRHRETVD